jgi:hypothetical protein
MPNWVYNKVYFHGDSKQIDKLKNFVTSKDREFDFEKIIPMPEELNIESGSTEIISIACAKARKEGKTTCEEFEKPWGDSKTFNEWADIGDKYLSNLEKYGATTWYEWSWKNWGTKWNACDVYWVEDDYVEFNTAWNAPEPIYHKLAELFPDIKFDVEFADEDIGSNCGTVTYDGDSVFVDYLDDFEFACGVWGYDPEDLREEYEQ